MPYEVFISYAHEDRPYLNELTAHLSLLQKQNLISTWQDTDISPGTEWQQQIMDRLDRAQIILLLISADFMHSDFCYSTEMTLAIQRHKARLACVIPIIIRPVYWEGAPFAELKVLPTDAKAVTRWRTHDDAFEDVVQGIAVSIKELQQKGKAPIQNISPPHDARKVTLIASTNP
ncbi:MAG TPA: toll/interleukin-1 receptor domain-containing protein [Ktedonobacteraceae bacterium]